MPNPLIAENKQLKHALKEAQDQLKAISGVRDYIINNIPHYIFFKDTHSTYLWCNQLFANSVHVASTQELIGKSDYDMPWSKEESDAYIADDKQVMKSRKAKLYYEETQRQLDGTDKIMLVSKVPVIDGEDNLVGLLCIYTDITDRKKAELALKEAAVKAEAASAAKTEFIRNMSHDLITPLTGIIGMAEVINGQPDAAVNKESAQDIKQAGLALLNLLNEIIETAQLESGELTHKKNCFELKKTIDVLVAIFRPALKQKDLSFELYYDDNIPEVLFGHESLLHRIILNLLGNALKFTDGGSIGLEVSLLQKKSDKVSLKIVVKDTGIGIPPDKQEMIFDKFNRLSPSYENHYKGSGLGLYMVKQFIQKLGGDVKVTSVPGGGAQFNCTVQFKIPTSVQLKRYLPKAEVGAQLTNKVKPALINMLLIENNLVAQKAIQFNLQSWGLGIVNVAATSADVQDKIAHKHYDLIYLDWSLQNRQELLTHIQNNVLNQQTPIIALALHLDETIKTECKANGVKHIVMQPLLEKDAKMIVQKFLNLTPEALQPMVDWELWRKRCDGVDDLLKETLQIFKQQLSEIKTKSLIAWQEKNYTELQHLVYNFYLSLNYCGLPRLETVTQKLLQALSDAYNDEQLTDLFDSFIEQVDTIITQGLR